MNGESQPVRKHPDDSTGNVPLAFHAWLHEIQSLLTTALQPVVRLIQSHKHTALRLRLNDIRRDYDGRSKLYKKPFYSGCVTKTQYIHSSRAASWRSNVTQTCFYTGSMGTALNPSGSEPRRKHSRGGRLKRKQGFTR